MGSTLEIQTDRQLIGEEDTFLWLSKGDLKAETESEIVALHVCITRLAFSVAKVSATLLVIIINTTVNITEELSEPNEKSDAKQDEI